MMSAMYLNQGMFNIRHIKPWFIQKVNHDIGGFSRVYLTHFRGFIRHIFEGLSAIFGGFGVIICENILGTF